MKVFVSYRRKDGLLVTPLIDQLRQYIYGSIFIDFMDIDEDNFEHSILHHLGQSDVVLVVVTERTFDPARIRQPDDWIHREISTALKLNKQIVLLLVENQPLPRAQDLPSDIRVVLTKQGIPLYAAFFKEAVQKLASFIGVITGTGGVLLLKRAENALLQGNYAKTKSEIERMLETVETPRAVAQANFLLALVQLRGQPPFSQPLSVMRQTDYYLSAAISLYPSYAYILTLASIKKEFARNGLPQLATEAATLLQRARTTPRTSQDEENLSLLSQCQPYLLIG